MGRHSEIRNQVVTAFQEAAERRNIALKSDFKDACLLSDLGLDSLGFAILVVILEDRLGFDPFSSGQLMYPKTFGDLVKAYESCSSCDA